MSQIEKDTIFTGFIIVSVLVILGIAFNEFYLNRPTAPEANCQGTQDGVVYGECDVLVEDPELKKE